MLDIKREIVTLAEWPDAIKVGETCVVTDEPEATLLRMTVTPAGVAETINARTGQGTVALQDGDMIGRMLHVFGGNDAPVTLFGFKCGSEVEGWTLRIADCYIGTEEHGRWLLDTGEAELTEVCAALALPRVGVLYRGLWDPSVVEGMSGGWVVKPAIERVDPERGRVAVFVPRVSKEGA